MGIFLLPSRFRQHFVDNRVEIYRSEKKDLVIYTYEGKYIIQLINNICINEYQYSTMEELMADGYKRDLFVLYELTSSDYERLEELNK